LAPQNREKTMKTMKLVFVVTVFSMLAACTSYYQVTDTVNGGEYYTKKVKNLKSGAVSFKDAKTGAQVTLQNNAVQVVDKAAYQEGIQ